MGVFFESSWIFPKKIFDRQGQVCKIKETSLYFIPYMSCLPMVARNTQHIGIHWLILIFLRAQIKGLFMDQG
jgi:hypothetical protein